MTVISTTVGEAAGAGSRSPADPHRSEADVQGRVRQAVAWQIGALGAALGITAVAITGYSCTYAGKQRGWTVAALLVVYAAASALTGGFLGFLFGVPRHSLEGTSSGVVSSIGGSRTANTNLEQVSDWLTRVLIGATLVEFRGVGDAAGRLFTRLGEALDSTSTATAFTGALICYSALAGFIVGWLTTRIWVNRLLPLADGEMEQRSQQSDGQKGARGTGGPGADTRR